MSNFHEYKVLVVDDDPDIREILTLYFKNKGYQTEDANSGDEAFSLIQTNKYDLVITDYKMKGGSGLDLLEKINTLEEPRVPVVMISKFTEISQEELNEKGCRAFLEKPIDRREVLKLAAEILNIKE